MVEAKFAVGDMVVLKSGGPPMTVSGVVRGADRFGYKTSWSEDEVAQAGAFPEDLLEAAPPPPKH